MNTVNIIGNLTRDPELRHTKDGTPVCSFSIAVRDKFNKEKTHFFNCTAWRKTGELINQYFVKGKAIGITGSLTQERWEKEGKNYSKVEIVVDSFDFIGGKKQEEID